MTHLDMGSQELYGAGATAGSALDYYSEMTG